MYFFHNGKNLFTIPKNFVLIIKICSQFLHNKRVKAIISKHRNKKFYICESN